MWYVEEWTSTYASTAAVPRDQPCEAWRGCNSAAQRGPENDRPFGPCEEMCGGARVGHRVLGNERYRDDVCQQDRAFGIADARRPITERPKRERDRFVSRTGQHQRMGADGRASVAARDGVGKSRALGQNVADHARRARKSCCCAQCAAGDHGQRDRGPARAREEGGIRSRRRGRGRRPFARRVHRFARTAFSLAEHARAKLRGRRCGGGAVGRRRVCALRGGPRRPPPSPSGGEARSAIRQRNDPGQSCVTQGRDRACGGWPGARHQARGIRPSRRRSMLAEQRGEAMTRRSDGHRQGRSPPSTPTSRRRRDRPGHRASCSSAGHRPRRWSESGIAMKTPYRRFVELGGKVVGRWRADVEDVRVIRG